MKTTQEINDNIIAQFEQVFGVPIPLLGKSFLRVVARVFSGTYVVLEKYGGFITQQQFIKTALFKETEINGIMVNPLVEWADLIGVSAYKTANFAELVLTITVENQTGFLNAGSKLVGALNSVIYSTKSSVELNAATVQVTVISSESGTIGNLTVGDAISFVNPLSNVAKNAVVASQSVSGAEAEGEQSYRERAIDKFKKRPQGGAYSDYEIWGIEPVGIVSIYPYTGLPGQLDIYAEATIESSGNIDGIPTPAQLQSVLDSINYDSASKAKRRSANAFPNVHGITRKVFEVVVTGISGVDNLAITRTDIETELAAYFLSKEPFILGLSVGLKQDKITRTSISAIVEEIVTARGGSFTSVTFNALLGADIEFYSLLEGEKSRLDSVSYL